MGSSAIGRQTEGVALCFQPMPSLKVEKQTERSADDSFKRISDLLSNDKDLKKLDAKYKAAFDSKTRTGTAEGSMFKAKLNVADSGPGSTVTINVELPLAMMLMKGMVEKTLQRKLEEALA
jgi:hypothetical protein